LTALGAHAAGFAASRRCLRFLVLQFSYFLMFLNIQIDLIILKTYDQQFTLAIKKSLHIIFKVTTEQAVSRCTTKFDW